MAAKFIHSKDKKAAEKFATRVPHVKGETTYWHNSYYGFIAGIRYARRLNRLKQKQVTNE
jgi:hypothetical protein